MQQLVGEHHLVEQCGVARVEQVGFELLHLEGVAAGLLAGEQVVGVAGGRAFGNQAKEHLQAVVKVAALLFAFAGEGDHFQLAQVFQRVALQVDAVAGGGVAEFGAGLNVEQEQQAVHVAQALAAELVGVEFVLAAVDALFLLAGFVDELFGGFVAEQFDAFTQGVFEVFGDAIGVFVGVFVEGVEQGLPLVIE